MRPLPVFGPYTCQDKTAFPCILHQRLQVRLDGHFCASHAVAGMKKRLSNRTCCTLVSAAQGEDAKELRAQVDELETEVRRTTQAETQVQNDTAGGNSTFETLKRPVLGFPLG